MESDVWPEQSCAAFPASFKFVSQMGCKYLYDSTLGANLGQCYFFFRVGFSLFSHSTS